LIKIFRKQDMQKYLIKNIQIVNEGSIINADVLSLDAGDRQRVDVRLEVVFRVRDRGLQDLAHDRSALFRRECEHRERLPDRLAADHVRDEAAFLRRDARVAQNG
jgi:hypothetical protein